MDGVLVHSNPLHCQAWEVFNRGYGLETTGAMVQSMYGKRNDQIIREFFGNALGDDEVAARGAAKEEIYRELAGPRIEDLLVPGLRGFLQRHREDPMALASNAEPANVDFILDRAALRPYFRFALNGHQVRHPKPDPEVYLLAAELLRIPPRNCLVFEDSVYGVEAARAAGARVIGILTTHGDLPGAALSIDNFCNRELEPWLQAQEPVV